MGTGFVGLPFIIGLFLSIPLEYPRSKGTPVLLHFGQQVLLNSDLRFWWWCRWWWSWCLPLVVGTWLTKRLVERNWASIVERAVYRVTVVHSPLCSLETLFHTFSPVRLSLLLSVSLSFRLRPDLPICLSFSVMVRTYLCNNNSVPK